MGDNWLLVGNFGALRYRHENDEMEAGGWERAGANEG
jgi:hypothetical protein